MTTGPKDGEGLSPEMFEALDKGASLFSVDFITGVLVLTVMAPTSCITLRMEPDEAEGVARALLEAAAHAKDVARAARKGMN